jgi:hypothetical protein
MFPSGLLAPAPAVAACAAAAPPPSVAGVTSQPEHAPVAGAAAPAPPTAHGGGGSSDSAEEQQGQPRRSKRRAAASAEPRGDEAPAPGVAKRSRHAPAGGGQGPSASSPAVAEAGSSAGGDADIEPAHWLAHQLLYPRVYFSNQHKSLRAAGVAAAVRIGGRGVDSDESLAATYRSLAGACPRTRFYGGMRFDSEAEQLEEWSSFGGSVLILPLWELQVCDGGRTFLACHLRWWPTAYARVDCSHAGASTGPGPGSSADVRAAFQPSGSVASHIRIGSISKPGLRKSADRIWLSEARVCVHIVACPVSEILRRGLGGRAALLRVARAAI